MPTFTAEELLHPNPNFGVCFALDVLLSGWEEANWTVRAYVGDDFSRSVISAPLAERLGLAVVDSDAAGEIVFQSSWEIGAEGL